MVSQHAIPNADVSVFNLMREIRNAPADELMIPLTMLGDGMVLTAMMVTIVGWLVWRKAWRAAIASTLYSLRENCSPCCSNTAFTGRGRLNSIPAVNPPFPSGHATIAAITFGVLAVLGEPRHEPLEPVAVMPPAG